MQAWLWWKTRRKFYAPTFLLSPSHHTILPRKSHFSSFFIFHRGRSEKVLERKWVENRESWRLGYCSNWREQKESTQRWIFCCLRVFVANRKRFSHKKVNEFFIVSYCALRLNSSFVQFISHPMLMYYPFCIIKSNITKSSSSRDGKNAGIREDCNRFWAFLQLIIAWWWWNERLKKDWPFMGSNEIPFGADREQSDEIERDNKIGLINVWWNANTSRQKCPFAEI